MELFLHLRMVLKVIGGHLDVALLGDTRPTLFFGEIIFFLQQNNLINLLLEKIPHETIKIVLLHYFFLSILQYFRSINILSVLMQPSKNIKSRANTQIFSNKDSQYNETLFYHPTKNPHNTSQYQQRLGNKTMSTFRNKAKPLYNYNLYESSLNPFARNIVRKQEIKTITGDRKKMNEAQSFKKTDPISMKYESTKSQANIKQFQPSNNYKQEVERRTILPCERKLSRSRIEYKNQIGYSRSLDRDVIYRAIVNDSSLMRQILQSEKSIK